MKTHNKLLDNYQEASWALAMEQVAIYQGKQAEALEEQLNSDPDAAVPQHTADRCQAAIRKAFAPKMGKKVRRIFYRVVIAAVLCAFLTMAACAVSPSFLEFLSGLFSHVTQTFTAITFRDPQVEDVGAQQNAVVYEGYGLQIEWLPDGYECVGGEQSNNLRQVDFMDAQSNVIRISITDASNASAYTYDSETTSALPVEVGEFEGWIIQTDEYITLRLIDEVHEKHISIYATDLSQEYLSELALALRY